MHTASSSVSTKIRHMMRFRTQIQVESVLSSKTWIFLRANITILLPFQVKWSDLLKLLLQHLSQKYTQLGPGFERPSAVQQRAILPILKGRDVIVQSQSGTGRLGVQGVGNGPSTASAAS